MEEKERKRGGEGGRGIERNRYLDTEPNYVTIITLEIEGERVTQSYRQRNIERNRNIDRYIER